MKFSFSSFRAMAYRSCMLLAIISLRAASAQAQSYSNSIEFTADGNFQPPAGVTTIKVELMGGGGGGGPISTQDLWGNGNLSYRHVAGGGGGAYAYNDAWGIDPLHLYNVQYGNGGTRGVDGKNSYIQSSTNPSNAVSADGGKRGMSYGEVESYYNCYYCTLPFAYPGGQASNAGSANNVGRGGRGGLICIGINFSGGGGGGQSGRTNGSGANGGSATCVGTVGLGGGIIGQAGSGGAGGTGGFDGINGVYPGGGGGGDASTDIPGDPPHDPNKSKGANGYVKLFYNPVSYGISGLTASNSPCVGDPITVNLTASSGALPVGQYVGTFNISGPTTVNGMVISFSVNNAGTASMQIPTSALWPQGVYQITLTNLSSGYWIHTGSSISPYLCSSNISSNNTATVNFTGTAVTPPILSATTINACPGQTINAFVQNIPVGKSLSIYPNAVSNNPLITPNLTITNPANGFTIESWIRGNEPGQHGIVSNTYGPYAAPFEVRTNGNSVMFFIGNGITQDTLIANNVLLNSAYAYNWFHVACVYDPAGTGSLKIYLNGELKATKNGISSAMVGNYAGAIFAIANRYLGGMPMEGNLDELRIWNIPRTQSQINASMAVAIATNSASLLGYYKFDESTYSSTVLNSVNGQTSLIQNNHPLFRAIEFNDQSASPLGVPYSSYLWTPTNTTSAGITVTPTTTTTYTVSTMYNGCPRSNTLTVNMNSSPIPTIQANGPTSFCSGNSVLLEAKNNAMTFDGVNDFIEDNTMTINPALGFTIEGWFNSNALAATTSHCMASRALNNLPAPFDCYSVGSSFRFFVGNGSSFSNIQTASNKLNSGWNHIACVYNASNSNIQIYINGVLEASGPVSVAVANAVGSKFRIGNRFDNGTYHNGKLDEIRIWNLVRTPQQILSAMYSTIAVNSPGLAAYYKLDDVVGSTTRNSVGGAFSATLMNGPVLEVPTGSPMAWSNYTWSPGGATTSSINATATATYTLSVTTSNGCTGTATQAVTVFNPTPVITGPSSFCNGDNATLQVSGFSGYSWSPGGASSSSISVNNGGTYSVTVTDANGCTGTDTYTINAYPKPVLSTTATPATPCVTENAQLAVQAGGSAVLELSAPIAAGNAASGNVFNITATNTLVLHYFSMGITSGSSAQIWYKPGGYGCINPLSSSTGWTLAGTASITPAGGVPNLTLIPFDLNLTIPAGETYGFVVVCNGVNYYSPATSLCNPLVSNSDLTISEGLGGNGYGGSFSFNFVRKFSGKVSYEAYDFAWSPSASLNSPTSPTPIAQNILSNTVYTVTATNVQGCSQTATRSITVIPQPNPVITAGGTTAICQGSSVNLTCNTIGSTSLNFTAVGQQVSVPYVASLDPTTALSLEAWIKPANVSGIKYIISRGNQDLLAGHYAIYLNNDKVIFKVSSTPAFIVSNASLISNTWTHIAGTWDGSTMRLYINGVLDKTGTFVGPKPANTNNLRIGWLGASNPFQYQFLGEIDEVRVWNTSRTQTDITNNMHAYVPVNATGLIAYFKLSEGSGTSTANAVSGMTAGTISGGPSWNTSATSGYTNMLWSPNASTSPSITVNSANTYTVTVTGINGCTKTATQSVSVNPLPLVNIGADGPTQFCQDDSVKLVTNTGGNGIQFSGSNMLIGPDDVVPVSGDYTVEIWAKQQGALSTFANFLAQGRNLYLGKDNNGFIRCGDAWANSGVLFPTDMNWHHYALVRTASNAYLYLDGALVATKGSSIPSPGVNGTWPHNLIVGAQWNASASSGFNGMVDELQIWQTARTQAQIQQDRFTNYLPSTEGLSAFYKFNEGSGTTTANSITNAQLLNFQSSPVWNIPSTSPMGALPYTSFAWSNGATQSSTTAFASGVYSVSATDANGCTASSSVVVTSNPIPNLSIVATPNAVCTGSTTQLSAITNAPTINWSASPAQSQSGISDMNAATTNAVVNQNTVYTATVSDANGCSKSSSVTVSALPLSAPPSITTNGPANLCNGSVRLNAQTAAMQFDGVDDYVEDNSMVLNPNLGFTIEGWMKVNSLGNNALASQAFNNIAAPFDIRSSGTAIVFYTGHGANYNYLQTGGGMINTGSWCHIACVYDAAGGGLMHIYVNGVLQASGPAPVNVANVNGSSFRIGNRYDLATPCNGFIDEVRIWNTVRTSSEIIAAMNSSVPTNSNGLLAYYKLEEGTGNTTINSVTSLPSGILYNGPLWQVPSLSPMAGTNYTNFVWQPGGATTGNITVNTANSFTVTATHANGCTGTSSIQIVPCQLTLNLKAYLQGYFINGAGAMTNTLANQGVGSSNTNCDSIVVQLHQANAPYALAYNFSGLLGTNGELTCTFPGSAAGSSYYIVVKHRNTIETWSANPVMMSAGITQYDFTSSAGQAYGDNQVQVGVNQYALYSGDLNQDDNIDLLDISLSEIDVNAFEFGYFASDLNGDGNVDLLDIPFLEENTSFFIFSIQP